MAAAACKLAVLKRQPLSIKEAKRAAKASVLSTLSHVRSVTVESLYDEGNGKWRVRVIVKFGDNSCNCIMCTFRQVIPARP